MTTLQPIEFNIDENILVGTVLGAVPFATDSAVSSFTVVGTTAFAINALGEISTTELFDFPTQSAYIFSVFATDADGDSEPVEVSVSLVYVPILTDILYYFADGSHNGITGLDCRDLRVFTPGMDFISLVDALGREPTALELEDIKVNLHSCYTFDVPALTLSRNAQTDIDAKVALDTETKRKSDIKAEADRIITSAYLKDKQDKLLMQSMYLLYLSGTRPLTTGLGSEQEELAQNIAIRDWMTAVRTIENTAIANGTLFADADWTV